MGKEGERQQDDLNLHSLFISVSNAGAGGRLSAKDYQRMNAVGE